ncbi:hypothetical protein HDU89_004558 [Geranomyces variabilis]|nr:hypothetical protein HDU89_004558 [Geranomyces variabilis]
MSHLAVAASYPPPLSTAEASVSLTESIAAAAAAPPAVARQSRRKASQRTSGHRHRHRPESRPATAIGPAGVPFTFRQSHQQQQHPQVLMSQSPTVGFGEMRPEVDLSVPLQEPSSLATPRRQQQQHLPPGNSQSVQLYGPSYFSGPVWGPLSGIQPRQPHQPRFYGTTSYNPHCHTTRNKTTKEQLVVLEAAYAREKKPDANSRDGIAKRINMPPKGVQIWFQNRRAKEKKMNAAQAKALAEAAAAGTPPSSGSMVPSETIVTTDETLSVAASSVLPAAAEPVDAAYQFGDPSPPATFNSQESGTIWGPHIGDGADIISADGSVMKREDHEELQRAAAFAGRRSRAMSMPSIMHHQYYAQRAAMYPPPDDVAASSDDDQASMFTASQESAPLYPIKGEFQYYYPPAPRSSGMVLPIQYNFPDSRSMQQQQHQQQQQQQQQQQMMDSSTSQFTYSSVHLRRGSCPPNILALGLPPSAAYSELAPASGPIANHLQAIDEAGPWDPRSTYSPSTLSTRGPF